MQPDYSPLDVDLTVRRRNICLRETDWSKDDISAADGKDGAPGTQ